MKRAQLVVLGIALAAGGGAAMLAGGSQEEQQPVQQVVQPQLKTVEVLVAATDIALGGAVKTEDLRWQVWPQDAANPVYVVKDASPNAIQDNAGSIARSPFVAGEPIRPDKLIKGNGSGYMAAILPSGMRAISIEISPETGAGGFILPNDRVDIILTRKSSGVGKGDEGYAETIAQNIRVLAVDQTVEDKDGQKVVVGKTATLELTPAQSEQMSLSRQQGTLSLALRSLVDSSPNANVSAEPENQKGARLTIVRFGVASSAGGR